jgi:hypothetical protein
MKESGGIKKSLLPVLGNLALMMLGVCLGLGLTELLLRKDPNLVPRAVRVSPPARRVQAFIDDTYDLKLADGDLFHWMRGAIVPLSPDQDRVVAHIHMTTDAHGFRNPLPEKGTYGIVALGDSFTRASGVAIPWPQKLADLTGRDVLNLADVGVGPQEELELLRQYGLPKRPQWVIMAFFEGNDLNDAAAYEQANPFILTRLGGYLLSQGLEAWHASRSSGVQVAAAPSYRYPITLTTGDTDLEIVFLSAYVAWLSVSGEAIESSENYRLATEAILKAQEMSEAAEAQLLLVYLPSKEHVYLPFLNDVETLARVYTGVPTLALDEAGYLQFTNQAATPELTRQHIDVQADLLAGFAAEHKIAYLDLTSAFQEAAGTGAELYYPYDTHWNQSGHDLAAQTIAQCLEGIATVTCSK